MELYFKYLSYDDENKYNIFLTRCYSDDKNDHYTKKKHINRIISLTEFAFIHMGTYVRMRASIVS